MTCFAPLTCQEFSADEIFESKMVIETTYSPRISQAALDKIFFMNDTNNNQMSKRKYRNLRNYFDMHP